MQWQQEIPDFEEVRKKMITEMYHELLRISGESDKMKVWGSAAKFELMLWNNSPDRNTYMTKMQRKIQILKKKTDSAPAQQQPLQTQPQQFQQLPQQQVPQQTQTQQPIQQPPPKNLQNTSIQSGQMLQPQIVPTSTAQFNGNSNIQQPSSRQTNNTQFDNTMLMGAGMPNGAIPTTNGTTTSTTAAGPNTVSVTPSPSPSTFIQRVQAQIHAQQQQLINSQNEETAKLRQKHQNQQIQLVQRQQQLQLPPEQRRAQLQTLQQKHHADRAQLEQIHKEKRQSLRQKQQLFIQQTEKKYRSQLAAQNGNTNSTTTQIPVSQPQTTSTFPQNPTASQIAQAQAHQQKQREIQRAKDVAAAAQQALPHNTAANNTNGVVASSTKNPSAAAAAVGVVPSVAGIECTDTNLPFVERFEQIKKRYGEHLVTVYREFERLVKQKPGSEPQERLHTFLVNLKKIISLLQQDPRNMANPSNLDRVEAHIQIQVLPILERLKDKVRAANAYANDAQALQAAQLKRQQEQQRVILEQQKAAAEKRALMEERQKTAAAAAALKREEELKRKQALEQEYLANKQKQIAQQERIKAQMAARAAQQAANAASSVPASTTSNQPTINTTTNGVAVPPSAGRVNAAATPAINSHANTPAVVATSDTPASGTVLTAAQYRNFKLTDAQKQRLTAEHAKLREQQQEILAQQQRSKSTANYTKLVQEAQRVQMLISKISQQLVQCKLAEDHEQQAQVKGLGASAPQPSITAPVNGAAPPPTSVGRTVTPTAIKLDSDKSNAAAMNANRRRMASSPALDIAPADTIVGNGNSVKSVVPDLTGLSASEQLLMAIATYEKHKPEVLKRSAERFTRIAYAVGAKLTTSYV